MSAITATPKHQRNNRHNVQMAAFKLSKAFIIKRSNYCTTYFHLCLYLFPFRLNVFIWYLSIHPSIDRSTTTHTWWTAHCCVVIWGTIAFMLVNRTASQQHAFNQTAWTPETAPLYRFNKFDEQVHGGEYQACKSPWTKEALFPSLSQWLFVPHGPRA